jgi:putative DNA primase/helicase
MFDIFTASSANSKEWKAGTIEWDTLLEWAKNPADKKESGGYVLGRFKGKLRRNSELISRSCLTLDADYNGAGLKEEFAKLGLRGLIHTTYSSAPDEPRYRIILPLERPVTGAEYELVAEAVAQRLGTNRFDRVSFRPAQFMWRPAYRNRDWYDYMSTDGPDLDPDLWIGLYDPTVAAESLSGPRRVRKRDPYAIDGIVGAFNRKYDDLDTLIAKFDLPYVKEGEDRYRYVDSKSVAGMGPVAGVRGLYYSHHATDPACGETCSAFDLVRIHMFGEKDATSRVGTPVIKLPSYGDMSEYAARDEDVKQEILRKDFGVEMDPSLADVDPNAWRLDLELNARGGIKLVQENLDIICQHDPLFLKLHYNSMTASILVDDPMPWDKGERDTDKVMKVDETGLQQHLAREYKLVLPENQVMGMIRMSAHTRKRNPLQEWLRSLKWDGVPRLTTCLPGVEDNAYTRMVARKAFIGAAARGLNPGCQMDQSLILYGAEGIGKSRFIRSMAIRPEWYGELESVGDKDTALLLLQKWIVVSDEVDAMRRSDFNQLKSFLTRTHDNIRLPYDRDVALYPRHCVIWGTTNDQKFLRRQQGNRRFLMIECLEKDDRCLDPMWVEQVWAEAVFAFEAGERLWLDDTETELANSARNRFTQEAPLIGKIEAYLNMSVPEDWNRMSTEARSAWYMADRFIAEGEFQQNETCAVAIAEEVLQLRGFVRDYELHNIQEALRSVPGWAEGAPGRHPIYGTQQMFVRLPDEDAPSPEGLDELL